MNWKHVDDGLPPVGLIVLTCDMYNSFVTLGRMEEKNVFEIMWLDDIEIDSEITHWMPIPKPPADDEDKTNFTFA